jgi:hypothetical protein
MHHAKTRLAIFVHSAPLDMHGWPCTCACCVHSVQHAPVHTACMRKEYGTMTITACTSRGEGVEHTASTRFTDQNWMIVEDNKIRSPRCMHRCIDITQVQHGENQWQDGGETMLAQMRNHAYSQMHHDVRQLGRRRRGDKHEHSNGSHHHGATEMPSGRSVRSHQIVKFSRRRAGPCGARSSDKSVRVAP